MWATGAAVSRAGLAGLKGSQGHPQGLRSLSSERRRGRGGAGDSRGHWVASQQDWEGPSTAQAEGCPAGALTSVAPACSSASRLPGLPWDFGPPGGGENWPPGRLHPRHRFSSLGVGPGCTPAQAVVLGRPLLPAPSKMASSEPSTLTLAPRVSVLKSISTE